jgi:hypothetical protein
LIVVKIIGGLGNQMFCYAYAKALQVKGHDVKIDNSECEIKKLHGGYQLDKYYIDLSIATKEEISSIFSNSFIKKLFSKVGILQKNEIREKSLLFDETLLNIKDNRYISGYFQTDSYFKNIRSILLNHFLIKYEISDYGKKIKKLIEDSDNSCSIHIRRGDYTNSINKTIYNTCDLDYYKRALGFIKAYNRKIDFFIFSDDINWVKDNLQIERTTYVQNIDDKIPHEDMYLMSLCKNNIIANSSFSWWGAWLNQYNKKIVVAPKRWFLNEKLYAQSKCIVPDEWKRI